MNNQITHVKKLLDRNDYRVAVHATDGGCLALFPQRIEPPETGFAKLYQQFNPDSVLLCTQDEHGVELTDENIPCPVYAQKLFTIYQVIFHCFGIGYNITLIKFMHKNEEIDEDEFLNCHLNPYGDNSKDELTKETKLRQLMNDCFQRGFQPMHEMAAEGEGIQDGFVALRRIFIPDSIHECVHNFMTQEDTIDE
jgi:hypothetical protein